MKVLAGIGITVLTLLAVGALVLGGWYAGWWFKEQNVNKESRVFRDSYANQERLREDAQQKIAEVRGLEATAGELPPSESAQAARLEVQASSITQIACDDISQITEPQPDLEEFAAAHCTY